AQMPAPDAELREGIVQLPFPFLSATAGLDRNQTGCESSELGKVGSLIYVERLDTVNRHRQPELSRGRIGDIGGIDDQGAAMLDAARNEDAPAWLPDHTGNQRKGIGNS